MLRFLPGSSRTTPDVPVPGAPFSIKVRVDNLGQTDASNLDLGLERWYEGDGWQRLKDQSLALIPGSATTSGYAFAQFEDVHNEAGSVSYRAILSGTGVELEHSELRFNVTTSNVLAGPRVGVSLPTGEVPLEFIGLDNGGLLFTTVDGELHARTITSTLSLIHI